MENRNLLSFSREVKAVRKAKIDKLIGRPYTEGEWLLYRIKNLRLVGILILLFISTISIHAQVSTIIPKTGSSGCSIAPNSPVCPNSTTTYTAPSGSAGYAWTITGSGTITGPANTRTVSVIAGANCNGSYTLTVSLIGSLSMTTCSQTIQVIDNSPPTISCAPSKTVPCNTVNIVFDTPTINDACSNPSLAIVSTTTNTNSDGTISHTRTWKATDACGNVSSNCSQTVTISNTSTCIISGSGSLCQGSSTTLCAPAGSPSYLWSTGETNQCITVTTAGTYSVVMVDANGCNSTGNKTVKVYVPQVCSITGNSSFCSGSSTTLSAPAGGTSYSWSNGGATQSINVNTPGNYILNFTDANGCSSQCSKTINQNALPVSAINGANSICMGASSNLCAPAGAASYSWNTGGATPCITISNSGNYTVVVTDANGCTSSASKNVVLRIPQTCSITGNTSICAGGSMNLCALSGATSYLWSTGETTACISASTTGNYTVSIIDANGCSSACGKSVIVNPPPPSVITGSDYFCSGGSISLCAPYGAFGYDWSTEEHSQCISINTAGTYSVRVTSTNGCQSFSSKTIWEEPIPSSTISGNFLICSGGSTILCAPSGYASYAWSTEESTPCITASINGNYSVTITGSNGCSSSFEQTVDLLAVPSCIISGEDHVCPGSTANFCAPSGMASYRWNTGSTDACISVDNTENYTVTITGNSGCTNTCTKKTNFYSPTVFEINGNSSFCAGGSAILSAPIEATSYLWNTGSTSQSITARSSGTYSVTITDANGCSSSASKSITVNNLPVCSISGGTSFCSGGAMNLCAPSGAFQYSWSTGATDPCIQVNTAGNYTLTMTDANGCSNSTSKTIVMNTPQACSISGNNSFCSGGSLNLCAPSGSASYLWNNGSTSQCLSINAAGHYSVMITDANGCQSTGEKNITINNLPDASISGITSFCTGGSSRLNAPLGNASYLWNTGETFQNIRISNGGTYSVTVTDANGCSNTGSKIVTVNNLPVCTITGNNSFCSGGSTSLAAPLGIYSYSWNTGATTPNIQVNSSGTYSVTITDANGCSNSSSKTVTMNSPTVCNISGNNSFCSGSSLNLCAPANAASYLWNTGATTPCLAVTNGGTYSVTVTDANGCSSSGSKIITMNANPVISISGNSSICSGSSTNICAPSGTYTYSWNTGATTSCLSVSAAGTYTATITDRNGCSSSSSKIITVNSLPLFSITGSSAFCAGGSTNICAPSGAYTYLWNTGATSSCISVNGGGTYSVTVTNASGCSSSRSKIVVVNTLPSNSITGNNSICAGSSTNLCLPSSAGSFLWNTGATTACINVTTAGTYSVTITDDNGCINSNSKSVIVNPLPSGGITGSNDICEGNSSIFTASGGVSYSWNTGATTASINVPSTGTYTVNVTDANGCQNSFTKQMNTHTCGVTLRMYTNICEFPQGTPTTVNYTYVIKNNSNFFSASGNLIDDNGTPSNNADDVIISSWGPLAPGDSITFTHPFTFTETHTNLARVTGTAGGNAISASATSLVTAINCNCVLGYPDNSNLPRSGVIFNESQIMRATDPGATNCGSTGSTIKLWYNDEHAMLMGVRSVKVITASGTTTTNYTITPAPTTPTCVSNPLVGDTVASGDYAANDVADGGGRPLWPALFITDLTVNGPNSRIGDWQQGGVGRPPTKVCGTWKSATKTIDKRVNPPLVTITTDPNPAKNNWSLGSAADIPPGGFNSLINEGYGTEVGWDINSLGLIPGHTYRIVFMVHDGDQNKSGGDVGEAGTTIHIPELDCVPSAGQTENTVVDPPRICYNLSSNTGMKASQKWTINSSNNTVTIRTTFSKNFTDNTYGNAPVGWSSGHTFSQLTGSEYLQMALYDASNVKKMEFKLDYLSASTSVPSGFKSMGVSGGEGAMLSGSTSDVVSCRTSLDYNLNTYGYILTSNSPATDANYAPNNNYPNWIYDVWYDVTVKLSAFGSVGFGKPSITAVEASPNKSTSTVSFIVDPNCITNTLRLAAPETPSHINVIAYPNPFSDNITINFIAPLEDETNIVITDITGRVVESFKQTEGTINMGRDLRPGIYFVILNQGEFYRKIKIIKAAGNE